MFRHFREVKHPSLLREGFYPKRDHYYCGYCIDVAQAGFGWQSESSCVWHVAREHEIEKDELVLGEHYLTGDDLYTKLLRFRKECQADIERFLLVLESIVTVEDFEIDFPEAEAA